MGRNVVLKEKLRLPDATGLARERLEKPLRDGPPTVLDFVVAPAGSGKTTLLSRVAASTPMPTGWYRITAEDSTEERLVAHLAFALRNIADVHGATSIDDIIGGLDTWSGEPGLLIVDDLHEISGTPAERALERLVGLRPVRLRLILGSRRTPDIDLPRIRLSGEFRELTSDDLRFRSWEVEELFATVYNRPLRPDAAAALTRRTGGWAAGLQMFHLATADRTPAERHQAVSDLGGRSKLVRSYLTRNVLAELPEDRRQFLLQTCTLGRLSGETCDALLGTSGSHRLLEELERDQLFTVADADGVHFRYHEILQNYLEMALIEQSSQAEARSWYAKSGAVLRSAGDHRAAARAYAKADDWAAVSSIVEHQDGVCLGIDVADGAKAFPPGARHSDPWLALANGRRLARDGALKAALHVYQQAETLYDEPGFRALCHKETDILSLWLPTPARSSRPAALSTRHWSSVIREALQVSPEFHSRPVPDSGTEAETCLAYGLAAVAAGELIWARKTLDAVLLSETASRLTIIAAQLALTALDILGSQSPGPSADLSELNALAVREGWPWIARLYDGLQQLGLARSDHAPWRFDCCAAIIGAAVQVGDDWGAALLSLAVAYTKLRDGINPSQPELAATAARCRNLGSPVLEVWSELAVACNAADASAVRRAADTGRALGMRTVDAVNALGPQRTTKEPALPLSASSVGPVYVHARTSSVRITCFDGYRLEVDDRFEALDRLRPQARNVLKILSLAINQDHHREFLEDVLWPGVDHATACHRLQVAVSSVRTLFGGIGVDIPRRGESYRLTLPAGASIDVQDFLTALSLASAASARGDRDGRIALREKAIFLYRGDLLPELTVDAVTVERERLRRSAAAAAAALASDYAVIGNAERALWAAQRAVDLDPGQDVPWRVLADLHEKLGDVSLAELVRREYKRMRAELVP